MDARPKGTTFLLDRHIGHGLFKYFYTICLCGVRQNSKNSTAKVGIIPVMEEKAQQKNVLEVKKAVGFVKYYETQSKKLRKMVIEGRDIL